MADHLRRAHHIPTLDLAEVGVREARRSVTRLRWHPDPNPFGLGGVDADATDADHPGGVPASVGGWFRCGRCTDQRGEGWDRYCAWIGWPEPFPAQLAMIRGHYQTVHPATAFDLARVATQWRAVAPGERLAVFVPVGVEAPAMILCDACRPANTDGPRLAGRVFVGHPAYGDARRLAWYRSFRHADPSELVGRSPLEQAEVLEARDRGLLLTDLRPGRVRAALARARQPGVKRERRLELALADLLRQGADRGESPTRLVQQIAGLSTPNLETRLGRVIPHLAAQEKQLGPAGFRRAVRGYLGDPDAHPHVAQRWLWTIWTRHVRDTDPPSRR